MRASPEAVAFLEAVVVVVASCQEEEVKQIRYRLPHRHHPHSSSPWFQLDTFPEVVAYREVTEPYPVEEEEAPSQAAAVVVEVE